MGGERNVKSFNAWCHLTVMLYAVIMRFDSLREITSATMMEWRKLAHLVIKNLPRRSTLSDANARRSHEIFGKIYQRLYLTYKDKLSSDSPSGNMPKLNRNESCGAHFREEHQTEQGEAQRDDEHFAYVAAWEYKGPGEKPELHKEALKFENVKLSVRSYK